MTLKVLTHDYVIEYLPIRDQLRFFDVDVETEELRLKQLYNQQAAQLAMTSAAKSQDAVKMTATPTAGNLGRCTSTASNSNVYVEPAVTTLPTAETEPDEMLEADKALLSPEQITSEADLYYAKMQYEERLKYALRYEFAFESPLMFVKRFFDCAFSPAER